MKFERGLFGKKEKETSAETEISPERKEIMESAREKRAGLLSDVMVSRLKFVANEGANFIPVVGLAKMLTEAAKGKTMIGEKLSGRRRFDYIAVSGGITLAYTLEFAGMIPEGIAAGGATKIFGLIEFGPETLKTVSGFVQDKMPAIADFLSKLAVFTEGKREEFIELSKGIRELIKPENLPPFAPYGL